MISKVKLFEKSFEKNEKEIKQAFGSLADAQVI